MKKLIVIILILAMCFTLFVACTDNNDKPDIDNGASNTYWGKVSGVVTLNDKPISGVTVKAGSKTVTTDENGVYTIEIFSDNATLEFEKNGCITQRKTFKSADFYREEINYNTIIFISTRVFGIVKDNNGIGVSDARVTIGNQSTVTDSNGYYEFDSVIASSMVIIVSKEGKTAKGAVFTDEMLDGECEVDDIILK